MRRGGGADLCLFDDWPEEEGRGGEEGGVGGLGWTALGGKALKTLAPLRRPHTTPQRRGPAYPTHEYASRPSARGTEDSHFVAETPPRERERGGADPPHLSPIQMALAHASTSRTRTATTSRSSRSSSHLRASWPTRAAVPSHHHCRRCLAAPPRANTTTADDNDTSPPSSSSSSSSLLFPRDTLDGWRVRPLDTETRAQQAPTWLNEEVRRVAALQSEAFQAPPAPPEGGALFALLTAPLQPLARASFSAEVLDALRGKAKGVADGSFAVLVAERVGDEDDQEQQQEQQQQQQWQQRPNAATTPPATNKVQGVVELRAAMDADVVGALRRMQQQGGGRGIGRSAGSESDALVRQVAAAVAASAAGVVVVDDASEAAAASSSPPPPIILPLEGDASPLPLLDNNNNDTTTSTPPTPLLSPFPPPQIKRVAYLASMAVDPRARRQGAARAMLAAAERLAACWGLGVMALHVYGDNVAALRLYERDGWREVERERGWWVGLIPGKRARVLMAKRVSEEARGDVVVGGAAAADKPADAAAAAEKEEQQQQQQQQQQPLATMM
jgi:hypothetical protein